MSIRRRSSLLFILLLLLLAANGAILWRRSLYRAETERLRAGMSELERARTDAIVKAESERSELIIEVMRRQADGDEALHLAVNTDSGYLALDRGAARLRQMPVQVGPERRVGTPPDTVRAVVPRGTRVIEELLGPKDSHPLPTWLWADRGLPATESRSGAGWTGPNAIVTSGGTLIYALPTEGPLADSSYVMPGALRVSARDLAAIRENLTPGMRVYFY